MGVFQLEMYKYCSQEKSAIFYYPMSISFYLSIHNTLKFIRLDGTRMKSEVGTLKLEVENRGWNLELS